MKPGARTTNWIAVAPAATFPPGTCRTLDVGLRPVAVFNVDGTYYAIEDICSHEYETLSDGSVEGCEIVCPRHAARFSLATGAALAPPAYEPIAVFPVRVADGVVEVGDDDVGTAGT